MKKNLLFLLLFIFTFANSQEVFQYKIVEPKLIEHICIKSSEREAIKRKYFDNARYLTSYLPLEYSKKGDVDYTTYMQKGIDENNYVVLPDFPVMINFKGLRLKSDSGVLFQKNSKLIMKPNSEELYGVLYLENVHNVKVYFANLEGDRDNHQGTEGEWGMGIFLRSSQDIKIYKPIVKKMWGDGIYIGNLNSISKNIDIEYAFIDENRRNGISIIAGEKITISNSIISNTYGASPEYGIDIEPNKPEDELKNIVLSNNTTYNNAKGGLLFALDNLQGKNAQPINVQVNNHNDYYSDKGIEFHIDRGYQKYTNPLRGTISINGANLYHNKTALINNDSKAAQIKLNLFNIKSNNIKLNTFKMNTFVEKFKQGKQQTF